MAGRVCSVIAFLERHRKPPMAPTLVSDKCAMIVIENNPKLVRTVLEF